MLTELLCSWRKRQSIVAQQSEKPLGAVTKFVATENVRNGHDTKIKITTALEVASSIQQHSQFL